MKLYFQFLKHFLIVQNDIYKLNLIIIIIIIIIILEECDMSFNLNIFIKKIFVSNICLIFYIYIFIYKKRGHGTF